MLGGRVASLMRSAASRLPAGNSCGVDRSRTSLAPKVSPAHSARNRCWTCHLP